ncbi:hypothetical protein GALMADRAFT_230653 [Galerina marginata CBS 339.88]|uniref:Uncharacterized protein n=1 Tax=Galerina marginata (strain CBS 339.88) TaxID=685588 RepID=A0A067SHE0_GALM3|nr:hypothetical protein GALMADRAFT_230653 [Galerina marginata CBS 339.88]
MSTYAALSLSIPYPSYRPSRNPNLPRLWDWKRIERVCSFSFNEEDKERGKRRLSFAPQPPIPFVPLTSSTDSGTNDSKLGSFCEVRANFFLSIRKMAENFGIRRSIGQNFEDLVYHITSIFVLCQNSPFIAPQNRSSVSLVIAQPPFAFFDTKKYAIRRSIKVRSL